MKYHPIIYIILHSQENCKHIFKIIQFLQNYAHWADLLFPLLPVGNAGKVLLLFELACEVVLVAESAKL